MDKCLCIRQAHNAVRPNTRMQSDRLRREIIAILTDTGVVRLLGN